MEGLGNFIEVDKYSALDVAYLKEGTRSFEVRSPKFEEEGSEVSIREGPEELKAQNRGCGAPRNRVSMLITLRRMGVDHLWLMLICILPGDLQRY